MEQLRRDNADLRRRLEALERCAKIPPVRQSKSIAGGDTLQGPRYSVKQIIDDHNTKAYDFHRFSAAIEEP